MTARKPAGYPCHVDDDLAHIATATTLDLKRDAGVIRASDLEPRPCTRRHKPAPSSSSSADLRKAGLAPRTAVRLLDEPARPAPPKGRAAPSSPAKPAQASPKARARPSRYTDEQRDAAVERVRLVGLAAAARELGIPKRTLSRWAAEAGVDLGAQARERTAKAREVLEERVAEVKVTTVERLERILDDQLATLEALGQLERRAATAALNPEDGRHLIRVERSALGRTVELDDTTAAGALELARLVTGSIVKRDVVGAATRAIHDLQLLKGDATERGAIVVRFGIPRPSALEADAQAVDEADLGASPPA